MENKIVYLPITSIGLNPLNPRKTFDASALRELSESIKELGVLQPITVRPAPSDRLELGEEYQLVCGERRWRAAAMAGLDEIPSIIRNLTDDEAIDVAITENLQRKDVSPLEEADAFKYLLEKGNTIVDLCGRFGKSEFYVRGRLKLLAISDDFRRLLDEGEISISQAMEIVKFDGDVQARMFADHFENDCWNSWRSLTARAIYQRAIESYTMELAHYKFDKAECERCPSCTKNSLLFESIEGASCQDSQCLQRKNLEYRVDLALKLQKQHPEADFIAFRSNSDIRVQLEEQGYEIKSFYVHTHRVGAVITRDLRNKIEAGAAALFIDIDSEPYLGYAETNQIAAAKGSSGSTLDELRKKDIRNAEIAEEKTVSEVRDAIRGMDVATLGTGDITLFEEQLTLFTLLKGLKKEQQEQVGKVKYYSMSDEEAWNAVLEATPEQAAYIKRCHILNQVGDHMRKDYKTELFFKWVNSRDTTIVPAADLKHQEVYLKRHEKIAARIAEIEMGKEE